MGAPHLPRLCLAGQQHRRQPAPGTGPPGQDVMSPETSALAGNVLEEEQKDTGLNGGTDIAVYSCVLFSSHSPRPGKPTPLLPLAKLLP